MKIRTNIIIKYTYLFLNEINLLKKIFLLSSDWSKFFQHYSKKSRVVIKINYLFSPFLLTTIVEIQKKTRKSSEIGTYT